MVGIDTGGQDPVSQVGAEIQGRMDLSMWGWGGQTQKETMILPHPACLFLLSSEV